MAANGGTLDLGGNSVTVGSFSGASGVVTNNGGSLATLTVTQNGDTTFGGTIADGATNKTALTVTGTGSTNVGLVLTGVNTYSGPTIINSQPSLLSQEYPTLAVQGLLSNSNVTIQNGALLLAGTISRNVTFSGGAGAIDDGIGSPIAPVISGSLTVSSGTALWNSGYTTVAGAPRVQGGYFRIGGGAVLTTPLLTVTGGSLDLTSGGTLFGGLNYTASNSCVVPGQINGASSALTMNNAAATLTLTNSQNNYGGPTTVSAGVLSAGTANALSPNSAVTVNGGTLDVSGYAQQIQSLNVGSLGTLNLGVGYLLSVSGSAGLAGTLDIIGSNSITSLPYALMTYSGSPTGTFGNVVGLPSTDKLSYGSGTLDIVASVNAPELYLDGHGRGAQDHRGRFGWSDARR